MDGMGAVLLQEDDSEEDQATEAEEHAGGMPLQHDDRGPAPQTYRLHLPQNKDELQAFIPLIRGISRRHSVGCWKVPQIYVRDGVHRDDSLI